MTAMVANIVSLATPAMLAAAAAAIPVITANAGLCGVEMAPR